jgi:hypothetical protein
MKISNKLVYEILRSFRMFLMLIKIVFYCREKTVLSFDLLQIIVEALPGLVVLVIGVV